MKYSNYIIQTRKWSDNLLFFLGHNAILSTNYFPVIFHTIFFLKKQKQEHLWNLKVKKYTQWIEHYSNQTLDLSEITLNNGNHAIVGMDGEVAKPHIPSPPAPLYKRMNPLSPHWDPQLFLMIQ